MWLGGLGYPRWRPGAGGGRRICPAREGPRAGGEWRSLRRCSACPVPARGVVDDSYTRVRNIGCRIGCGERCDGRSREHPIAGAPLSKPLVHDGTRAACGQLAERWRYRAPRHNRSADSAARAPPGKGGAGRGGACGVVDDSSKLGVRRSGARGRRCCLSEGQAPLLGGIRPGSGAAVSARSRGGSARSVQRRRTREMGGFQ